VPRAAGGSPAPRGISVPPVRRLVASALVAAAAVLPACGDDDSGWAVGRCTTGNPNELISFDVELVDCSSREARSRIRSRKPQSKDCGRREASVEDPDDSAFIYCYGPK
jgi:hypothetical protein